MNNSKIETSFDNRIMTVTFKDGAMVSVADLKEIYTKAYTLSKTQKYCIIFQALGRYEVLEEAVAYMIDNPENANVLAKAYVLNSTEAETKTKLHLRHDKPKLQPLTFKTLEAAKKKMREVLVNSMI